MARRRERRKPKPEESASPESNGNAGNKATAMFFFLPKRMRTRIGILIAVGMLFSSIYAVDRGWPIAVRWWRGFVSFAVTDQIEVKVEEVETQSETCLMQIRDMRTDHNMDMKRVQRAQEAQQQMSYNIWADVRAMRGMAPPPTPVPVPTFPPPTPEPTPG